MGVPAGWVPAGWAPAGSLLTSYSLAGRQLAGWLDSLISYASLLLTYPLSNVLLGCFLCNRCIHYLLKIDQLISLTKT